MSRCTVAVNPGVRNWRADTLIATYGESSDVPHVRAAAIAFRMTHSPIGAMSPDSSATSMNWSGDSRPRLGCSHRSNASKPAGRPSSRATIGWYSSTNASSSIARSSDERTSSRAITVLRIHDS